MNSIFPYGGQQDWLISDHQSKPAELNGHMTDQWVTVSTVKKRRLFEEIWMNKPQKSVYTSYTLSLCEMLYVCILMCRKICLIPRNWIIRACLLHRNDRNAAKTAGKGTERYSMRPVYEAGWEGIAGIIQWIWNDNTFISRKTFEKLIRTVWKIDGGAQLSVWRYAD